MFREIEYVYAVYQERSFTKAAQKMFLSQPALSAMVKKAEKKIGMPLTLIPILAAIWPAIDPCHTTLNNVGDLVGTTIISRQLDRMDMDVFNSDEEKQTA